MNHLTHMTLDGGWHRLISEARVEKGCKIKTGPMYVVKEWVRMSVAERFESLKRSDEYNDKEFAKEMKRTWRDRQRQPRSVRRMQRTYTCSRPCCGRQSSVSVYTDMEGVRKPSVDVRCCAFCGVAWSVTLGAICDPVAAACEKRQEDEAWGALAAPVLKSF